MFYRSDLAYIVRRRGYKVIGEILGNTNLSRSSVEKGISEENDVFCDGEDVTITGEYVLLITLRNILLTKPVVDTLLIFLKRSVREDPRFYG